MPKKSKKPSKKQRLQMAENARMLEVADVALEASNKRKAEEAAKRAEEERIRAEEERKQNEEEAKRLQEQRAEDKPILQNREENLKTLNYVIDAKVSWERYCECNPLPDCTQETDLNTYRSLWKEPEPKQAPLLTMSPLVNACYISEMVIALTQSEVAKAQEETNFDRLVWFKEYTDSIRDITQDKLDVLTTQFIQLADEYENEDKKEALFSYTTPELNFGLWVHTAKKSRIKEIDFKECAAHVELPLTLQKTRNAIRFIQTNYDHISNQHRRFDRDNQDQVLEAPQTLLPPIRVAKEEKKDWENYLGLSPHVRYVSVGGVVNIQQLALPPPSKLAKNWTMRQITPLADKISTIPYPNVSDGNTGSQNQVPLRVTYKVPDFVLIRRKKPEFGWWDDHKHMWQQDGVKCLAYDEKTRIAEVEIFLLRPFAVIQPRALDFPYREWSLSPVTPESALLRLRGSRFEIVIEILPNKVKLIEPSNPVLVHLHGKELNPGELLLGMRKCGINLLPTNEDSEFCRKPLKHKEAEENVHKEAAMVAGLFEMTGSNWNSSRDRSKIMFRIKVATVLPQDYETAKLERPEKSRLWTQQLEEAAKVEAKSNKMSEAAEDAKNKDTGERRMSQHDQTEMGLGSTQSLGGIGMNQIFGGVRLSSSPDITESMNGEDQNDEDLEEKAILEQKQKETDKFKKDRSKGTRVSGRTTTQWLTVLATDSKFKLVMATRTSPSEDMYPGAISHASLRRCLAAHYVNLAGADLNEAFFDMDDVNLDLQQSIHRLLTLTRVFTFF